MVVGIWENGEKASQVGLQLGPCGFSVWWGAVNLSSAAAEAG